jgi:hypothetical protein
LNEILMLVGSDMKNCWQIFAFCDMFQKKTDRSLKFRLEV